MIYEKSCFSYCESVPRAVKYATMRMAGYMFDTNIFNEILDAKLNPDEFRDKGAFFVTNVQAEEIEKTKKSERRKALQSIFNKVSKKSLPTASFILDYTPLDEGKLSDGELFDSIKSDLDELNRRKDNNLQDALIAETALSNKLVLVTNDQDLIKVMGKHQGITMTSVEFFKTSGVPLPGALE